MSSTTKSRRTDPDKTAWWPSVALTIRLGEIMKDLGIEERFSGNSLVAGMYSNAYSSKVILVGSNPSQQSPDNSAFHPDTKSRKFVDKWFEGESGIDICYMNLVDWKTKDNKPLTKKQIKDELRHIEIKFNISKEVKIIGCGKIACMGLKMAGIPHFEMPHPSGLCRFWNDKEAGEAKVKEMLEWVRS